MSNLDLKHLEKALYLVRMAAGRRRGNNSFYSQAVIDKRDQDLLRAAYDLVKDSIGEDGELLLEVDGKIVPFYGYAKKVLLP